jgi:heat shock protein HslJ
MNLVKLALLGLLAACADETLSGQAETGAIWTLTEIGGAAPSAPITLEFPQSGQISGRAPCNRYFAAIKAPLPWFQLGPIGATKRACPDLDLESRYFAALAGMTQAEVRGDVLILTDDLGAALVFARRGAKP